MYLLGEGAGAVSTSPLVVIFRGRLCPITALSCLERWKEVAAAARSKTSALSFRRKGTVELVPVISPPPYKVSKRLTLTIYKKKKKQKYVLSYLFIA